MAWVIICLADSTSSLLAPAFKYLKAPIKKYNITKNAAMEKIGPTSWLVASPSELYSCPLNPKLLLISTWAIKVKMVSLLWLV